MSVYKYNFASVDFNNENTKFTFTLDSVNLISPVYFSDGYLFKKGISSICFFLPGMAQRYLEEPKRIWRRGGGEPFYF